MWPTPKINVCRLAVSQSLRVTRIPPSQQRTKQIEAAALLATLLATSIERVFERDYRFQSMGKCGCTRLHQMSVEPSVGPCSAVGANFGTMQLKSGRFDWD
jgi:hypothetical protein